MRVGVCTVGMLLIGGLFGYGIDQINQTQQQTLRTIGTSRSTLKYVDMDQFLQKLESDRLLLAEIRKDVPQGRDEAEVYLVRLKQLASRSDPVRLVPLANRILDNAPIFFDWLDREFESAEEEVTEYYIGGARGFHFALETFKSAARLTVINRLDIAKKVVSELDSELTYLTRN